MPIEIEKLKSVRKLITHDNCTDGLGSAMVILDALPDLEVEFVQYGTKAYKELQVQEGLLFCDIIPPAERCQEFVAAGAVVLDHHKKAEDLVKLFGDNGVFADESLNPGVSGTVLGYQEVWLPLSAQPVLNTFPCPKDQRRDTIQEFATLVGIRDTWQRSDPRWEEAMLLHQTLSFFPKSYWISEKYQTLGKHLDWFNHSLDTHIEFQSRMMVGKLVLDKHLKSVAKTLGDSYRFTESGINVMVFEGLYKTSDAMEMFENDVDVVIGFSYTYAENQCKLIVSCRSRGKVNVSELAHLHGGGGHTRAAGFSLNKDLLFSLNPYLEIERIVRSYLHAHSCDAKVSV